MTLYELFAFGDLLSSDDCTEQSRRDCGKNTEVKHCGAANATTPKCTQPNLPTPASC